MNIFYRRPLCIILLVILCGFSVFPFLSPMFKALFAGSALLLVLISSLLTIKKHKITLFSVCAVLLLISVLLSFLYFDFYARVEDRFAGRVTVEGKIHEIKVIDEEEKIISYTIKTSKVDKRLAIYKLTFTTSGDDNSDVTLGSRVSLSGRITGFAISDKEMHDYYFSLGIVGAIDGVTNLTHVSDGSKPLDCYANDIRNSLTEYAVSISNESSGTLLSALLFGERQALMPSVKTSFTNIGISHILALSGMHITILCLAANKLLLLLRVRRRERLVTTILLCLSYMILTGMSVSVVRAAIMTIISQTLSLLFKSSDSITSLFLSVLIIIIFTPYSVYSVSLWLSAFATLGVILSLDFADVIPYKKSLPRYALRFLFTSVLSSVFALSATILLSSLTFNKFSSLSLISTLIFSLLIEIIMLIGVAMLIVANIIPFSIILNPLVDFTILLADKLSGVKNAVISTNSYINAFLAITTLIFAILITARVKSKNAVLTTVIALLILSGIPIIAYGSASVKESSVYYTSLGNEDVLILKDGDDCHLISYGNTYENNAYEIYDFLLKKNIHSINSYILFDVSDNSVNEMSSLLSRISVKAVLIPEFDDNEISEDLQEFIRYLTANGVELGYFSENVKYEENNFSFLPIICKDRERNGNHAAFFASLSGNKALYLSSGILKTDTSEFLEGAIAIADALVLGKLGSSYSENHYFDLYFENLDEIIFSGNKIYLTPDTATQYIENGCKLTSHPSSHRLFN